MTALTPNSAQKFILDNTALIAPPHVPEIVLRLADEAHDLWQRTEDELVEIGLPPPFWAFAWAGGQGKGQTGLPAHVEMNSYGAKIGLAVGF